LEELFEPKGVGFWFLVSPMCLFLFINFQNGCDTVHLSGHFLTIHYHSHSAGFLKIVFSATAARDQLFNPRFSSFLPACFSTYHPRKKP